LRYAAVADSMAGVTETSTPAAFVEHPDTFGIPPHVYHRRWAILGVLTLSLVMVVTAVSSLNVAIPSIRDALDATGTELQWIVDAYALVFAGVLLPAGALGDRFGRKGALQAGLVVFALAALAASLADSAGQLIALRAVLGIGAAFIMPATLSIVVNAFPGHERPRAIAIWAGFAGVGGALGPISSGLLLEHFWWGSVFFLNVVLGVLLLAGSALIVPRSKAPAGHPLDPLGSLLSMVGLAALVFGVIEGPERGWTDALTLGGFAVAIVTIGAFIAWELRTRHPMLDPRLFRYPGFSAGALAITFSFFSMFGLFFLLTQYLQYVKGFSALQAGLSVLPNAVMLMVIAPRSPRLVHRFGVKRVLLAGFLLSAAGFTILAFATPDTPYPMIAIALLCTGAGMAALMPPASQHVIASLPLHQAGVGSAVNDVTREVGGALGIAVIGSVAATVYRAGVDVGALVPDPVAAELAGESIGQANGVAQAALAAGRITAEQADALRDAAGAAFTSGTAWAFGVMAVIATVTGIVASRRIPDRIPQRHHG
jgi:DHA2 family multidrug resistance protein-like MFS transporter